MHVGMHSAMSTTYAVTMRSEEDELDAAVDETLTASRALLGLIARSLAEVLEQVTLPQYRVLVVLCAAGPLRSGELAERVGVHQSTLTRTADRLVAQGLIQRDPSPDSRREIMVSLTDRGQAMVVQVMRQRSDDIREILGSVSEKDRKVILAGFREFARVAGEPENEHLLTLGMS
jgi:DNA-binding MarR family transcriptional regulator